VLPCHKKIRHSWPGAGSLLFPGHPLPFVIFVVVRPDCLTPTRESAGVIRRIAERSTAVSRCASCKYRAALMILVKNGCTRDELRVCSAFESRLLRRGQDKLAWVRGTRYNRGGSP